MPDTPIPTVTLADIEAARTALEGVSIYTPMEESRWLTGLAGGPVFLKCENLQRTGSFKIRGAYLRMSRLSAEERAAGVVAASAGNHAQGVALAAQMLGITATVFILQFLYAWNAYLLPLVFTLSQPELRTLAVGMTAFMGEHDTDWAGMAAAAVISLTPVIVVFVVLQRRFVDSLAGAVKQ